MLDPLTSLGLASNVIQLVDFGGRVLAKARELTETGTTEELKHLKTLTTNLTLICSELLQVDFSQHHATSSAQQQTSHSQEASLHSIAQGANAVTSELTAMIENLSLAPNGADEGPPAKRRRTALKRVVKGMWKEKDIQQLRSRLNELQQAMSLRILATVHASSPALLSTFDPQASNLSQRQIDRLERYSEMYHGVHTSSTPGSNPPVIPADLAVKIDQIMAQARTVTFCRSIMHSLAFHEIHDREQAVAASHANTCAWVFERSGLGFADWASSQNGLFWITGKPGSGKSTLMKYIVNNRKTQDLLQHWAGVDRVVMAYHYFWHAGTPMQKSEVGLLRTLLYHIIQQYPDVSAAIVPEKFRSGGSTRFGDRWTAEELRNTIRALADAALGGVKLCFFIDGLDEFAGDHTELVDLIAMLSKCSAIKLCVSSRPWNVFTRAYDGQVSGQLAVHELTGGDILTYINDTVAADTLFNAMRREEPEECEELIQIVTAKAQGVFLWIRLVLRSLLRGLRNDDDIDTLMRRVSDYPEELDAYYERMFDRIESVYRQHSARILKATLCAGAIPIRAPRCIELEMTLPDYARDISFEGGGGGEGKTGKSTNPRCDATHGTRYHGKCLPCWGQYLQPLQTIQNRHRKLELMRLIDARCADFLELAPDAANIGFIHRTASDFLQQDALQRLDLRAGASYDPGLSLARVYYTCYKADGMSRWLECLSRVGEEVGPANHGEYLVMVHEVQGQGKKPTTMAAAAAVTTGQGGAYGRGRILIPSSIRRGEGARLLDPLKVTLNPEGRTLKCESWKRDR